MTSGAKTLLAVMAHPDDAEICMGGTLAAFSRAGWRVVVAIASIPDKRERRIEEARTGAALLGTELRFFDCGRSEWQVEDVPRYRLTAMIDEVVREVDPQIMFSHWTEDAHHDHSLLGHAAQAASRHSSRDLYMCEQPNLSAANGRIMTVNTYVDVTDTLEACLGSVRAHMSQTDGRPYEEMVKARAAHHGSRAGCRYAEAFCCVRYRLVP